MLYKSALWSEREDMTVETLRLHQLAKSSKLKASTMGLVQGHQSHVLDGIELGHAAWDPITQETIIRGWIKADTLASPNQAHMIETFGKDMPKNTASLMNPKACII